MIREFRLPDVGEGVAEGELVEWLVAPGDPVREDQPVAEVETDKALVEIPSPYDGTVHELHAAAGDVVPVGDVLLSFDVPDEEAPDEEAPAAGAEGEAGPETTDDEGGEAGEPAPAPRTGGEPADGEGSPARTGGAVAPPRVRRLARERGVDLDAVDGSGPGGRVTEGDVRAAAEAGATEREGGREADAETADDDGRAPAPRETSTGERRAAVTRRGEGAETAAGATDPAPAAGGDSGTGTVRERTLAAPATRRIAEEAGIDIDAVPTDETRDGEAFVTPEQVREHAESRRTGAGTGAAGAEDATADATETAGAPEKPPGAAPGERVPYRGVRRTIGERMVAAKRTVPHVTHHDEVDATELVALREELDEVADVHLTYLPFVMKAVVSGLREFPYVNAQLDEEREEIVLRDEYNLGVATATDAGLMVPVVEDVDGKGLEQLARESRDLAERARDRTVARDELRGGTFTITNVGAIGGEYATPIVNPPEVAILALGAIRDRPWVVDGEVVARKTLPLSLSIDHRVIDGAVAARFTNHVKDLLANPSRLLVE